MTIAIFLSRNGSGRDAARLTVVGDVLAVGIPAGDIAAVVGAVISSFGNGGTGGRALFNLRGVGCFCNRNTPPVNGADGADGAFADTRDSSPAVEVGASGVSAPSGDRTNQAGSGCVCLDS